MPRNTREWCHREIRSIENHAATIGIKCEDIIKIYEEKHKEIAQGFQIINDLQEETVKILEVLKSQI